MIIHSLVLIDLTTQNPNPLGNLGQYHTGAAFLPLMFRFPNRELEHNLARFHTSVYSSHMPTLPLI